MDATAETRVLSPHEMRKIGIARLVGSRIANMLLVFRSRGHANAEFLCEIQGEEWIQHEATEPVDEDDNVVDPEGAWILVIDFSYSL
jgi:hypothetical protein